MMRGYGRSRLRVLNKNNPNPNIVLTIPVEISRLLSESGRVGDVFECALTPDGILFRHVASGAPAGAEIPPWVGDGDSA